MAVEMAGISKFKLQLLALVSESRHLREREQSARNQLDLSNKRQRQIEAEYGHKLQELHAELASRDDLLHKLQAKVKYLEYENILLEKKEKELKDTVNSLLQSRDNFISIYENSTYTLRQAIETRDRKISVLSEKMNAHMLLIDSIGKEATGVKKVLHEVQHLVNEKEHIVTELKVKMDRISSFEKDFVNINFLESKLNEYQHELRRRTGMISELKEYIEAQKMNNSIHPQIEEKTLLLKEEVIQSLTSDKQALHLELHNLELSLHKIENVVANMSPEHQKALSPVTEVQGVSREENESFEIVMHANGEDSLNRNIVEGTTETSALLLHKENAAGEQPSRMENVLTQCLPNASGPFLNIKYSPSYSSPWPVCPDPSSKTNANPRTSTDGTMDCNVLSENHLDSENSTTGIEARGGL